MQHCFKQAIHGIKHNGKRDLVVQDLDSNPSPSTAHYVIWGESNSTKPHHIFIYKTKFD